MKPPYAFNQSNLPADKYRYRTNWRGKLILQVGCARKLYNDDYFAEDRYEWYWKDATAADITEGKIV